MLAPIVRSAKANSVDTLFATCHITLPTLGDNAGIVGAAVIGHEMRAGAQRL